MFPSLTGPSHAACARHTVGAPHILADEGLWNAVAALEWFQGPTMSQGLQDNGQPRRGGPRCPGRPSEADAPPEGAGTYIGG